MAKMIRADSKQTRSRLTTAPGTLHFMPPEALDEEDPIYGTPVDVFSFAGVALHLFSEEWPTPSAQKKRDPNTKKLVALSEAQRRQHYIDKMINITVLKDTVVQCLEDDPDERPKIYDVSKIIDGLKTTVTDLEANPQVDLEAIAQFEDIKVPIDQSNPMEETTSEEIISNQCEKIALPSNSVKITKTADLETNTQFEDIKVPINQSNPVKATIFPEPHKEATTTNVRCLPNDSADPLYEDMYPDDYDDDQHNENDWDGDDNFLYDHSDDHDCDDFELDHGDYGDDDYGGYGDDDYGDDDYGDNDDY